MTHAQVPAEVRHKVGIGDGLIRFSVGIEDVEDLRCDIDQALTGVLEAGGTKLRRASASASPSPREPRAKKPRSTGASQ